MSEVIEQPAFKFERRFRLSARYPRLAGLVFGEPWMIMPEKLESIATAIELRMEGIKLTPEQIAAASGPGPAKKSYRVARGGTAVIPVHGVLQKHADMFDEMSGATSVSRLVGDYRAALADDDVRGIVFDHSSPGGSVLGPLELHTAIMRGNKSKPSAASVNSMMASASYLIGSAGQEIYANAEGVAGSIGVISIVPDESAMNEELGIKYQVIHAGKWKNTPNSFAALSQEEVKYIKQRVDDWYGQFVGAVRAGRPQLVSRPLEDWADGKYFTGQQALEVGLVDRIGDLEMAIESMASRVGSGSRNVVSVAGAIGREPMATAKWDAGQKSFVLVDDGKAGDKLALQGDGVIEQLMQGADTQRNIVEQSAAALQRVPLTVTPGKIHDPAEVVKLERQRVGEIRALCEPHGFTDLMMTLVEDGSSVVDASKAVIKQLATTNKSVTPGAERPAVTTEGKQPDDEQTAAFRKEYAKNKASFMALSPPLTEEQYIQGRRRDIGLEELNLAGATGNNQSGMVMVGYRGQQNGNR